MEDEITDTNRTTSKSPESSLSPPGDLEGIKVIICDADADMYKSLYERSRTWLDSFRSSNFEKKMIIGENKFNTIINNELEEVIMNEVVEMQKENQVYEKSLNEFVQENNEIKEKFKLLSFHHTVLSYHNPLLSRNIENLQECSKSEENDMKDSLTILENLTEENRRRSQSLDRTQSEMSLKQELIDDLFSKLIEEKNKYEVYLEETQELDRTEAELETFRTMLKDNHQTLVDLETEEANLISLLEEREKTLEKKLIYIKKLPGYLAQNMMVIEDWKAKNQIQMAENERMREMCEDVYEKMKGSLDNEIQSKEKKIAESLNSMRLESIEEANQNLRELNGILSSSQRRTENNLKAKRKELEEAKKQIVLIDKKEEELADLEQNIELEQFMRRLRNRPIRSIVAEDEGFRSPILGTPSRVNKESP